MAKMYLTTLFRIGAWFLVILGVLFTVLQAYLIGVPGLLIGGIVLWNTNATARTERISNWTPARSSHMAVKNPFSVYLSGRFSAGGCYFEPNDQNPRSPQFRSLSEQTGDDVRDYDRD